MQMHSPHAICGAPFLSKGSLALHSDVILRSMFIAFPLIFNRKANPDSTPHITPDSRLISAAPISVLADPFLTSYLPSHRMSCPFWKPREERSYVSSDRSQAGTIERQAKEQSKPGFRSEKIGVFFPSLYFPLASWFSSTQQSTKRTFLVTSMITMDHVYVVVALNVSCRMVSAARGNGRAPAMKKTKISMEALSVRSQQPTRNTAAQCLLFDF